MKKPKIELKKTEEIEKMVHIDNLSFETNRCIYNF